MKRLYISLVSLVVISALFVSIIPVSFAQKMPSPSQYNSLLEYQRATGKEITKFSEAPMLAELVKQGKLPPVEQRLPADPMVVMPVEKIGEYGGTWKMVMLGPGHSWMLTRTIDSEGLVRWGPDFATVLPNIAKKWEASKDGKVYTFYLRKGLKWSDGYPFTADDIMFWYEDVFLNKELTPTFPDWLVTDGKPVVVKKIDDYTVRFEFAQPNGLFLANMAAETGHSYITPKHYMKQFHPKYVSKDQLTAMVKKAGVDYWYQLFLNMNDRWRNPERPVIDAWKVETPIGTSTRVACVRNPYYWKVDPSGNQLPYIDRVTFDIVDNIEVAKMKAMNGEVDFDSVYFITIEDYPVLAENKERGGYRFYRLITDSGNIATISFNLNHKDPVLKRIFNDRRFRIAMSLGIDRKEIIGLVTQGRATPRQPSPPPQSIYYHKRLESAYIQYDPKTANKLLDEIGLKKGPDGWRLRPDGKPLGITIETCGTLHHEWLDIANMVKTHWERLGVKVAIKDEEQTFVVTRVEGLLHDVLLWGGDPGMAIFFPKWYVPVKPGWNAPYAPLWSQWFLSGGKSGEEPPTPVKNQMNLYKSIMRTTDKNKQRELMKKILDISSRELYVIGVCSWPPLNGLVKNNLRNVPEEMWSSWWWPEPAGANSCQFFFE